MVDSGTGCGPKDIWSEHSCIARKNKRQLPLEVPCVSVQYDPEDGVHGEKRTSAKPGTNELAQSHKFINKLKAQMVTNRKVKKKASYDRVKVYACPPCS